MAKYKVKVKTECLTQPVNGSVSGQWLLAGATFDSTTTQNKWVKVSDKRWLPLSVCDVVVDVPPVEPPPSGGGGERIVHVLELVNGQWVSLKYYKVTEMP